MCSAYSCSAATSPSRSSAEGRSSNNSDRRRAIASPTSCSTSPIASLEIESGYSSSICRRMSTALITWIGSSWMSAAICRRSSSCACWSRCASSRRCCRVRRSTSRLQRSFSSASLRSVMSSITPRQNRIDPVLGEDRPRLVVDPQGATVLRPDAVLVEVRARGRVRLPVRRQRALDVVGMELLAPELGVGAPLVHREPEDRLDLRAGVQVGRQLVGPVDVEDRRHALDQRLVRLRMEIVQPVIALAHRSPISPASRAVRGTTLSRSSHSEGE